MKLAVDAMQAPEAAEQGPVLYSVFIVIFAIVQCIVRIFSRTFILNSARSIEFRIREELYRKLTSLDDMYFSHHRTGDLISRFSNDLTNVRMLSGFGVLSALNALIVYGAAVTLMARINPSLTILAIAPFPAMILLVKQVSHRLFHRSLKAQEELARLTSLTEESVSAVRLIKSYCREHIFLQSYKTATERYLHQNLGLARLRGLIIPVMALATGAGTLIMLYSGGKMVAGGIISLGDFVAFSGYLAMLVWPTATIGWIMTLAQRGAASMNRLAEVLTAEARITDKPEATTLTEFRNEIEFRSLSFAYQETTVLSNLSLRISAGETIGITGNVGCGKTTFLKLLPRLVPVSDNSIYIDGRDINSITLASLRNLIGYVPQETFLFSRTIRENIAYGLADDNETRVRESAQKAGLNNDINLLRSGIDTVVGERGITLSGGQKQRVSLARALASNPPILLLDDPLAAVDAGHEEGILEELRNYYAGRTVIIVSQRFSAFRDCSRVIVLKEGSIAEEGAPDELVKRGGVYAEMARLQQLREEIDSKANQNG